MVTARFQGTVTPHAVAAALGTSGRTDTGAVTVLSRKVPPRQKTSQREQEARPCNQYACQAIEDRAVDA